MYIQPGRCGRGSPIILLGFKRGRPSIPTTCTDELSTHESHGWLTLPSVRPDRTRICHTFNPVGPSAHVRSLCGGSDSREAPHDYHHQSHRAFVVCVVPRERRREVAASFLFLLLFRTCSIHFLARRACYPSKCGTTKPKPPSFGWCISSCGTQASALRPALSFVCRFPNLACFLACSFPSGYRRRRQSPS